MSQASVGGSAARERGWEPGPSSRSRASLSGPSGTPASPASAPGVPGGSAPAQAVAPLPGAVDEAQGVLELLVGGFLDGLTGEVHLCGACREPEGCTESPQGAEGPWGSPAPGVTLPWNYIHAAEISCSSRRGSGRRGAAPRATSFQGRPRFSEEGAGGGAGRRAVELRPGLVWSFRGAAQHALRLRSVQAFDEALSAWCGAPCPHHPGAALAPPEAVNAGFFMGTEKGRNGVSWALCLALASHSLGGRVLPLWFYTFRAPSMVLPQAPNSCLGLCHAGAPFPREWLHSAGAWAAGYLVDGFPPGVQCRQESVQFRCAAQVNDPGWEGLLAVLGKLLGRAGAPGEQTQRSFGRACLHRPPPGSPRHSTPCPVQWRRC